MYHKGLRKDVLVAKKSRSGLIKFWDTVTRMWVNDKPQQFSPPKKEHN